MGNEIKSEKFIDNMVSEIKNYYFKTELGKREVAMALPTTVIHLSNSFPYYDLGVRGLEIESSFDIDDLKDFESYKFYVDLSFLFSDIYSEYFLNEELYFVSKINIISNEMELIDKTINMNKKLFFDLDISDYNLTYLLDKMVFSIDEMKVFKDMGFSLSVKPQDTQVYIIYIRGKDNLDLSVDYFNEYLSNITDSQIILTLTLMSYDESLEYLDNFLSRINSNKKMHLTCSIYQDMDRESFRIFLNDFFNYRPRLEHPDFQNLKQYQSKFRKLDITVHNLHP